MVTVRPISHALVPVDSEAAARLCSPNYDEFQSDEEIVAFIRNQPDSVLQITMPHCRAAPDAPAVAEGSPQALELAAGEMAALRKSGLTREIRNVAWIYEIADPRRPGVRQIGLGGMAQIDEIRTEKNPGAPIIRNEGIREEKAAGRAELIQATRAFIGIVNNAIDDADGRVTDALVRHADAHLCDYEASDEEGNTHKSWLIDDSDAQALFFHVLATEPCAYVADGNHRSNAAAMLGSGEFLAVFFPAQSMGLAPYNRLVDAPPMARADLESALQRSFRVTQPDASGPYQPAAIHDIGLYTQGTWYRLRPRDGMVDPAHAVENIDSHLVHRFLFDGLFGISDPRDKRLTFVGGNRDAAYLQEQVDKGLHAYAVTLAPVRIEQFIDVCRQNRIMPPKSTWFQPKIRSGLMVALRSE